MSNTQAINKTWLVIISRTMNMVNQATFTASKQNQVHQQETNIILVIQRIALSMHLLHSISAPISPYPFHAIPFPIHKMQPNTPINTTQYANANAALIYPLFNPHYKTTAIPTLPLIT